MSVHFFVKQLEKYRMHGAGRSYQTKYLAFLLATAAMITGASLQAAPINASRLDDATLAAALTEATAREEPRFCDELVPLWAETQKRADPPATEASLESANAQVWCAIDERRFEDASSVLLRTETRLGRQQRFDVVALRLNSHLFELEQAVSRIGEIAKSDGGSGLTQIEPGLIFEINRKLVASKRADLKLALWSSFYAAESFGQLDPNVRGTAGLNLLQAKADARLLTAKDSELVDLVTYSALYSGFLAERRYAALWPYIEKRAGDNMGNLLRLDVEVSRARFQAEPENAERLAALIESLIQAGDIKGALAISEGLRAKAMESGEIDERTAWAINYMAVALRADGRTDEAIAALDRLASLDPEQHPWVVNFVINHAFALAEEGRHEEALASFKRAQPIADSRGSPFARALVVGQRACSLHALARTGEAKEALERLTAVRADVLVSSIGFAMCAGREDLAIAWALEALADDGLRHEVIAVLQPSYMNFTPAAWASPDPNLLLAKSPELAAAFDKVARVVPERFAPLGGKARLGAKPADTPEL
jgi:tetratricopeptide (TPR) repeat protein